MKDLLFGKGTKGILFRIILLISLLTIPFWYHYRVVYVDGVSMTPTYQDGQWTLMQRTRSFENNWRPERFDVIVVWSEKLQVKLCKRVLGLPGETVRVVEGKIYIDDKELADSFGEGKMVYRNFIDPNTDESWFKEYENIPAVTIAPNTVWVIGDCREDSYFGHFQIRNIKGKIVLY